MGLPPLSGKDFVTLVINTLGGGIDQLLELVGKDEIDCLEFKAALLLLPEHQQTNSLDELFWEVAKGLIALANTGGGALLLGVNKQGVPIGIEHSFKPKIMKKTKDELLHNVMDRIFSRSNWKIPKKGIFSFNLKLLVPLITRRLVVCNGKQIVIFYVNPVQEELFAVELKENRYPTPQRRWPIKVKGEAGEVHLLERVEDVVNHQGKRWEPDLYQDLLKKFYAHQYPHAAQELIEHRAYEAITTYLGDPGEPGRKVYGIPGPDGNLSQSEKAEVRSSLLACALEPTPCAFSSEPFEVGTVLGLERGGYLAIINRPLKEVHRSLVWAEDELRQVLRGAGRLTDFPERWWLRLNLGAGPQRPYEWEDIWKAAQDKHDVLIWALQHLKWRRTDDGRAILPGILLSVKGEAEVEKLDVWCSQLVGKFFPQQQVTVVICLEEVQERQRLRLIRHIRENLGRRKSELGHLPLYEFHCPPAACAAGMQGRVPGAGSGRNLLQTPPSPGQVLKGFIDVIFEHIPNEDLTDGVTVKRQCATIIDIYQNHLANLNGKTTEEDAINYYQMVQDLENMEWWAPQLTETQSLSQLCLEILQMVKAYRSHDLNDLLKALGRSPKPDLRYTALLFSCDDDLPDDLYLEWWIEGTGYQEALFPAPKEFGRLEEQRECRRDRIFPRLFQTLLKKQISGGAAPCRSLVEGYLTICPAELEYLAHQVLADRRIRVSDLVCGRLPLMNQLYQHSLLDLGELEDEIPWKFWHHLEFWWLLGSIRPQRQWLQGLPSLPEDLRVILGLVSASDAKKWQTDQTLAGEISDRSRGLKPAFYTAPTA